jgi:hypothetical protein
MRTTESNNAGSISRAPITRRQFGAAAAATSVYIARSPLEVLGELANTPAVSTFPDIAPAVLAMLRKLSSGNGNSYYFSETRIHKLCRRDSQGNRAITAVEQADKLWNDLACVVTEHVKAKGHLTKCLGEMQTQGIEGEVIATLRDLSSRVTNHYHQVSIALRPALIELFSKSPDDLPSALREQLGRIRRLAPTIQSHLEENTVEQLLVDHLGRKNELYHAIGSLEMCLSGWAQSGWWREHIQFTSKAAGGIKIASNLCDQFHQLFFQVGEIAFHEIQFLHTQLTSHVCDWLPRSTAALLPQELTPELIAQRAVYEVKALPHFVKKMLADNPSILRAIPAQERQSVIDSFMERCARDLPETINSALRSCFPSSDHIVELSEENLETEQSERPLSVDLGWPDDWRDIQGNDFY